MSFSHQFFFYLFQVKTSLENILNEFVEKKKHFFTIKTNDDDDDDDDTFIKVSRL